MYVYIYMYMYIYIYIERERERERERYVLRGVACMSTEFALLRYDPDRVNPVRARDLGA